MPEEEESSLQLFRGFVQKLGQIGVLLRDALRVMSGQVDGHAVVDVKPFRMVFHLLDGDRGRCHEAEGMDEVGEFVFLVQLGVDDAPTREGVEGSLKLGAKEFPHNTIMYPAFRWYPDMYPAFRWYPDMYPAFRWYPDMYPAFRRYYPRVARFPLDWFRGRGFSRRQAGAHHLSRCRESCAQDGGHSPGGSFGHARSNGDRGIAAADRPGDTAGAILFDRREEI